MKFEINGQVQLSRNLRVAVDKIKNMHEFYQEGIDIIHHKSNEIFQKKGSNVEKNPKWKNLSGKTLEARSKRWGYYKNTPSNPTTLRWTGRLQDDVTKKSDKKGGILAYNAPYAIYHQQGSSKLPQRAIIDLDNQTNNLLTKALQMKINRDIGIFGKQK